jgi:hypothetical protein
MGGFESWIFFKTIDGRSPNIWGLLFCAELALRNGCLPPPLLRQDRNPLLT